MANGEIANESLPSRGSAKLEIRQSEETGGVPQRQLAGKKSSFSCRRSERARDHAKMRESDGKGIKRRCAGSMLAE